MPHCKLLRAIFLFGAITGLSMFAVGLPARYWSGGIYSGIFMTGLSVLMSIIYVFFLDCVEGKSRKSALTLRIESFFHSLLSFFS